MATPMLTSSLVNTRLVGSSSWLWIKLNYCFDRRGIKVNPGRWHCAYALEAWIKLILDLFLWRLQKTPQDSICRGRGDWKQSPPINSSWDHAQLCNFLFFYQLKSFLEPIEMPISFAFTFLIPHLNDKILLEYITLVYTNCMYIW